jgi:cytochrome c-type biogenesis protein
MKFVFAFMAGLLTTLSPCVLPVLPFVTASSLSRHKAGPLVLVSGLWVSFVGVSLLVSASGYVFGLDPALIRKTAGALLALSGALFLSHRLADGLSARLSGLGNWASQTSSQSHGGPLLTEFVGGILLGFIWTPCSGPSLGAALGLAAQSGTVMRAALILSVFGVAAVLPLVFFAYGARNLMNSIRSRAGWIDGMKKCLGVATITFGLLIVTGMDRKLEGVLTNALPGSWIGLLSRF